MAEYTLPPVPIDPTNPLILRQWLFEVFKKQETLIDETGSITITGDVTASDRVFAETNRDLLKMIAMRT